MNESAVKAWAEKVILPTYETGKPEKNPIFLEKRVYQGSSGSVYPHPVIEKISGEKVGKEWLACWLENDFVKIMILPELGGRVQMAYDKLKKRHFVYYNQVIKPALVGLTGPWISGGIEFNWPQHHRPSTYDPLDYRIEEHADGSKTVWCSEIERMFRTKGMAGFTLYPDKAYLEVRVKLVNRTPQPQTFLWWANPAVSVNDEYQSVFPPDVHAVFDHGRRDVSRFPIATGTYYKVDYSSGVDISRYKNIPVPTSYMAVESRYDFLGGYEHDTKGGLVHVANRHLSTGKKQWTWGNADFGQAWERNLTDEDGPYVELMCGVFCDNQPDFSWIMPYEEKSFSQYFMPYRDIGMVKNATNEAMLNLEFEAGKAIVKVCSSGVWPDAHIILTAKGKTLFDDRFNLHPGTSFERQVAMDPAGAEDEYQVKVTDSLGRILVQWSPEKTGIRPVPEPARPAREPREITSVEQLYLTGLHLEQYRHATFDPADYYLEALNRDPGDIRSNNAMGLRLLRKGLFGEAEKYFRKAVETLTDRNPNPYDGEPLFNLGMSLRYQGRDSEAFDVFYKAIWNAAWMDSGYYQLARIAASRQSWEEALELIDRSLLRNWHNQQARHLKAAILRKLNRKAEALTLIDDSLKLDRFNYGLIYESTLWEGSEPEGYSLDSRDLTEYALDYYWAGLCEEALDLLKRAAELKPLGTPLLYYYQGWILAGLGRKTEALGIFRIAEQQSPDYCFPNQLESVLALECAMAVNPDGPKAPYYLGNFWYHVRQYQNALSCWERSASLDDRFPTVFRNLALAYYNKFNAPDQAREALEKAFSLDTGDSRILMELDQLYKKLKWTPEKRLQWMEQFPHQVNDRDDQYLERIVLYNQLGNHEKAYELLMQRTFHPWEGGEGKVTRQYQLALMELAKKAIGTNEFQKALDYLDRARNYPDNLGEGKLTGARENDLDYWKGCALEGLGRDAEAREAWESAANGIMELSPAWVYNDQPPEKLYFKGLALKKLGRDKEAAGCFNRLIDYGEKHLFDSVRIDYFTVSLPDLQIWEEDLKVRNEEHCRYLIDLGRRMVDVGTLVKKEGAI